MRKCFTFASKWICSGAGPNSDTTIKIHNQKMARNAAFFHFSDKRAYKFCRSNCDLNALYKNPHHAVNVTGNIHLNGFQHEF